MYISYYFTDMIFLSLFSSVCTPPSALTKVVRGLRDWLDCRGLRRHFSEVPCQMLCKRMSVIGLCGCFMLFCFIFPNVEIPSLSHDRNWSPTESSEVTCEVSYAFTKFYPCWFFLFFVSCHLSEVNEWCKEMGAAAWPSCVASFFSQHESIIFPSFFSNKNQQDDSRWYQMFMFFSGGHPGPHRKCGGRWSDWSVRWWRLNRFGRHQGSRIGSRLKGILRGSGPNF